MFTGTYLLADIPIHIESIHDEVQQMCAPYATDLAPEVTVRTTASDIAEESRQSDEQRRVEGLVPFTFTDSYLETLAVYRQIAQTLLGRGILLMHGSVIAVDGEAYMFTALSGTGKSTHVRLWRRLFGQRAVMINDDKPLLRIASQGVTVYGTPWDGKHHLSTNISAPLRALVVLRRGETNEIHRITAQEAFPTLMQQSFRTHDPMTSIRLLQLLHLFCQHVGLYELHCNMDPEAAVVASRGLQVKS